MSCGSATPGSWQNHALPAARTRLKVERTYSDEEYARLARGFIPAEMEDKWFIFLEGDCLRLHRSWTGFCVYEVRLLGHDGQHTIGEVWVNRDPEQYSGTNDEHDVALLLFLIDRLLLGYEAVFPARPDLSPDQRALYQWSQVGSARSRDEPLPERFRVVEEPREPSD